MPDLSTLLQQHVDQLSGSPAGGFPAVRAKARRRTQQRVVGVSAAAAVLALVATLVGTGAFRDKTPRPGHPTPTVTTTLPTPAPVSPAKAATLVQTHWRMTSITAFGTTTPVDDEQVYLYVHVPTLGGWLMRVHCGNLAGGATLGQSDTFSTTVKATGSCAAQPLTKAVAEVFRSPLNDKVVGQQLTLVGASGAMSFVAEPETVDPTMLTSHLWQLTRVKTADGLRDLSEFHGASPDVLWLSFGRGGFMAQTGCDGVQGVAVTTLHYLDLAGGSPIALGNCTASTTALKKALAAAYGQLVTDGRVQWNITGSTLELRGVTTVMTFTDHGPAASLQGTPASASASAG